MKKIVSAFFLFLYCTIMLTACSNQSNISAMQAKTIEKAILKAQEDMKNAAENFDADALFKYVLDVNDVIIENGLLRKTRKEALDITKQNLQGIQKLTYSYSHKNINVLSSTTALWTGIGTSKAVLNDGRELTIDFTESIFFVLQNGQWKVLHAHRSSPN